ncbi:NAD(+) diphosphatase [Oceanotoga sp. DSM 15011]|uniref:NAD(+) diphosphatase n=1 Tax=Oceanotoga sp. DSM 15011 TaxID=2984951 RepID=UPI0021F41090|nr:NAD(+) diphosphatase [Oceanotoga sp. DSM 15011]UYO99544.1 NAD(+) diphosphatase [Oceanotoga sp. DSM 15011]
MININWDPDIPEDNDFLIVCISNNEIFINTNNCFYMTPLELQNKNIELIDRSYIGKLNSKKIFAINIKEQEKIFFEKINLRNLLPFIEQEDFIILSRALEIINWKTKHKFCGKCGERITENISEGFLRCNKCGFIIYPEISPAIIVGITKDDKILLAHNDKFKENMYSIIAGFVEWGESLEDTVKREVMEEIGITIKNIKYFNSQTWPFPNSLMVGFTAEYDSGEIIPDGVEITDAKWFDKNNLPDLPKKGSIARNIIDTICK